MSYPHVHPPFNTAQVRFINAGYHMAWRYKVPGPIGPGEYDVTDLPKITHIIDWDQKMKLEMFAKNLGFFNNQKLEERKFLAASGGPGAHDIPKCAIVANNAQGVKPDIGFGGLGPRFKTKYKNDCPPPAGTYNIKGTINPVAERKIRVIPRFPKEKDTESVGPGVYNYDLTGSVNYLLNRCVSSKGPYKIFTGPRDERTIFGYLKRAQNLTRDIPMLDSQTAMKVVFDPHRQNCGKWYPGDRFSNAAKIRIMLNDPIMRDYNDITPAPGHFQKISIKTFKKSKYPFNNSNEFARPNRVKSGVPGAGRYDILHSKLKRIPGNGHRFIFQSKIQRGWQPPPSYNSF